MRCVQEFIKFFAPAICLALMSGTACFSQEEPLTPIQQRYVAHAQICEREVMIFDDATLRKSFDDRCERYDPTLKHDVYIYFRQTATVAELCKAALRYKSPMLIAITDERHINCQEWLNNKISKLYAPYSNSDLCNYLSARSGPDALAEREIQNRGVNCSAQLRDEEQQKDLQTKARLRQQEIALQGQELATQQAEAASQNMLNLGVLLLQNDTATQGNGLPPASIPTQTNCRYYANQMHCTTY